MGDENYGKMFWKFKQSTWNIFSWRIVWGTWSDELRIIQYLLWQVSWDMYPMVSFIIVNIYILCIKIIWKNCIKILYFKFVYSWICKNIFGYFRMTRIFHFP